MATPSIVDRADVCATAKIIALPGAASAPVLQHPRRGRYPRVVAPIHRAIKPSEQDKCLLLKIAKLERLIAENKGQAMCEYWSMTAIYIRSFLGDKELPDNLREWAVLGNKYAEESVKWAAIEFHVRGYVEAERT